MNLNYNWNLKEELDAYGRKVTKRINPDSLELLWFFPAYLTAFFFVERINTNVTYHNTACFIDNLIPFNEYFVIPYFIWHVLIIVVITLTLTHDDWTYRKLMKFIIIGSMFCFAFFLVYPSCTDLRPTNFERYNVFVDICKLLYTIDTPTNVCPSMHVVTTFGLLFAIWEERDMTFWNKIWMLIIAIFIILSTLFLKQHAFLDVLVALPISYITWRLSFYEAPLRSE